MATTATSAESGGCWVCDDMGVPGPHRHSPEQCFCNPRSRHFKKEVHARRLQKMKRDNRSLTDRVKALGEPPADAVYSTILDQSESLLRDVNVSSDLIAQIVEQWIDRD